MALSTKTLDALNDSRKTEPHKYIWGQFTPDKEGVGYTDLPEQTDIPDDAKLVLDVNGPSLVTASITSIRGGLSGKIATTEKAGIVKPDGTTISVSSDGTISSSGSGFDFEGTKVEFDAAVAAGTITDDSVSLITDDVSGDTVATKAELQAVDRSKADTNLGNVPSNYDYVVESQVNADGSWYRKYKSGWLEQGGLVASTSGATGTVQTFIKPFANTNYTLTATARGRFDLTFLITSKTATTFSCAYSSSGVGAYDWRAEGQGA